MLLVLGAASGCGTVGSASVAHLSGQVTLDNEPLPTGAIASVTFRPTNDMTGRPITAEVVNSRYDCEKAPTGSVVAHVSISIPTGRTFRSERTGQDVPELEDVVLTSEQADGIELEVTSDATVDFELQKAKR